jgi:D-serine deaminase-like pyridoxal phosphate-dependent protein
MENTAQSKDNWYQVENVSEVCSPALLVYPDRIEENIIRTILIADGPENLRPHVKTHKMAEELTNSNVPQLQRQRWLPDAEQETSSLQCSR